MRAQRLSLTSTIVKQPGADRRVSATISTGSPDRDGDVVVQSGIDLAAYRRNPVVLWAHDYRSPPIARASWIGLRDGNLAADVEFPEPGISAFADRIFQLIETRLVGATSIGFTPRKWRWREAPATGILFEEVELLEFSFVPVPANSEALIARAVEAEDVPRDGPAGSSSPGRPGRSAGARLAARAVAFEALRGQRRRDRLCLADPAFAALRPDAHRPADDAEIRAAIAALKGDRHPRREEIERVKAGLDRAAVERLKA